jgi:hypothetical protein
MTCNALKLDCVSQGADALALYSGAALLHVTQDDVNHRGHDRIAQRIMLADVGKPEILENRHEAQIDRRARRGVPVFAFEVEIRPKFLQLK